MQSSLESAPTTASDAELLAAFAASGDDPAFAELVRRHLPLVLAVTRRRLGGSGLAEDAAQQVFIALSRRVRQLKGIPCLPAWLQRAAVLESTRLARGESRHRLRNQQAGHPQGESGGGTQEGKLDSALASLPERDRQVLLLHHFEKLAYDQVARRLGISAEAAQRRGHRALEKLRALFLRQGVSRDEAACVLWLGAGLAPAGTGIPKGFVEKTAALKKSASFAVPWLPLAAVVVLGGGTWALVQANKPAPVPLPVAAATSTPERPAPRKRTPLKADSELSDELREFISLAKRDSAQAGAWVKEREDWTKFIGDAMPILDERDPAAAERFLAVLESQEARMETITAIFDARAKDHFDAAVAWIDGFAKPFERLAIQSSMSSYINTESLEHDYRGALKFTRTPEVRQWLIREACEKYAAIDETGIEAMAATLQGDDRRVALGWAASLLLQRGNPRAFELLDEAKPDGSMLPDPQEIARRDPQAVIEWILRQGDDDKRHELARSIWRYWGQRDAVAAATWGSEQNAKTKDRRLHFRAVDATVSRLMKEP